MDELMESIKELFNKDGTKAIDLEAHVEMVEKTKDNELKFTMRGGSTIYATFMEL